MEYSENRHLFDLAIADGLDRGLYARTVVPGNDERGVGRGPNFNGPRSDDPRLAAIQAAFDIHIRSEESMMVLHWTKDDDDLNDARPSYHAESGDRSYVIRRFDVAARDGDPGLTMIDDRLPLQCWSLVRWLGNVTKGPRMLFNELGDALLAAQSFEDHAQDWA